MLVKFFGFLDLFAAGVIILLTFDVIHSLRLAIVIAAYLIVKGVVFIGDVASVVDILTGVYVLIAFFHPVTFLSVVFAGQLVIKGTLSLV